MRTIFTLAFLCLFLSSYSQTRTSAPKQLFYFYSKDSLVGVKDSKGKVLIEPQFTQCYTDDIKSPIQTRFISLINEESNDSSVLSTYMSYFDHNGKFLFHPYWFDNGPDFYNDGLMRFIENNKFGFADRAGNKQIAATYDYAEAFRYGLSFICNGCKFYRDSTDEENLRLSDGAWGLINTRGDLLIQPGNLSPDQVNKITDSLIALSQAEETAIEKSIISKIEAIPAVKRIISASWKEAPFNKISFHISERPSAEFPYFLIKAYGHDRTDVTELEQFLASKDGKALYTNSYDYTGKPEPISRWIEANQQPVRSSKKRP